MQLSCRQSHAGVERRRLLLHDLDSDVGHRRLRLEQYARNIEVVLAPLICQGPEVVERVQARAEKALRFVLVERAVGEVLCSDDGQLALQLELDLVVVAHDVVHVVLELLHFLVGDLDVDDADADLDMLVHQQAHLWLIHLLILPSLLSSVLLHLYLSRVTLNDDIHLLQDGVLFVNLLLPRLIEEKLLQDVHSWNVKYLQVIDEKCMFVHLLRQLVIELQVIHTSLREAFTCLRGRWLVPALQLLEILVYLVPHLLVNLVIWPVVEPEALRVARPQLDLPSL